MRVYVVGGDGGKCAWKWCACMAGGQGGGRMVYCARVYVGDAGGGWCACVAGGESGFIEKSILNASPECVCVSAWVRV